MKKIQTRMTDLPRLWDEADIAGLYKKHFTIGNGKAQYCLWNPGPCGLYYCFQVNEDGYACKKRAVEPTTTVFLHIEGDDE